jgi:hypothetical protein
MAGQKFWICGLIALIAPSAGTCGGLASRHPMGSTGSAGRSDAAGSGAAGESDAGSTTATGSAGRNAAAGSGAAGESDAGSTTATASTWVTDLTDAYCMWAIRCGKFPDAAACNAYMGPQFNVVNFNAPSAAITAVSKGTARFNATQATACLTALSNLDCDSDLLNVPNVPAQCVAVFSGSASDGSSCIDDVECKSGSMCVVTSTATCEGKCVPASDGACRTNDDCPAQQYCAGVPIEGSGLWGSGSCEARVAPGAAQGDPCGSPVQCAPGFSCGGGPAPARCVTDLEAGAACDVTRFAGPSCAPGLACITSDDGMTATCMRPAKLGEACTSLFQCGAQYDLNDLICDEADTHTCVHRRSTGPCNVVSRTDTCDPLTSYCDAASSTCSARLSQGTACVFPASGIDPCALWNSCQGPVCLPLLGACTPK